MPMERLCLTSADGHVGAPVELYRDYVDPHLRGEFDSYLELHISRWAALKETSYWPREMAEKFRQGAGFVPTHGTSITWDANLRLKAMNESRVACEVLFPDDQSNNDPPWGSGLANAKIDGKGAYPPEYVRAGARAYNRWLADFCSTDPRRLLGLTILGTLDDVVWCCEEVRRAYDSGLRTGVMLALEYYLPRYHHPRYDILWETLSELDLPVVVHIGRGMPDYLGEDPRVQFSFFHESQFYTERPVWSLILGGILERFPKLRMVITEIGVTWLPPLLAHMDESFKTWPEIQAPRDPAKTVELSMLPSEYWRRQCFVTHSTNQRREEFEGSAFASVPNMMFGADIGHMEGWWPVLGLPDPAPNYKPDYFIPLPQATAPSEAYSAIWSGLPASTMLPYLQDNFFRAFTNVDRPPLEIIAAEICPTTAELGLIR